jgi:hypothetical protein
MSAKFGEVLIERFAGIKFKRHNIQNFSELKFCWRNTKRFVTQWHIGVETLAVYYLVASVQCVAATPLNGQNSQPDTTAAMARSERLPCRKCSILRKIIRVSGFRFMRALVPFHPMLAPALFGGVHTLPAKLFHEQVRVFLLAKG